MKPLADPLANARDQMILKRRQMQKDIERLDKMIENLQTLQLGQPESAIPPAKEDEYKGLRPIDALESYLRNRKGMRVTLSRAIEDLMYGGVEGGKARGKQTDAVSLISHALKIAMQNRRGTFCWQPEVLKRIPADQITIWLADNADQIKPVKRWNRKKGTAAS